MFIENWVNKYVTSIGVTDFLSSVFVYTGITVEFSNEKKIVFTTVSFKFL
jgi:hypothetical protein